MADDTSRLLKRDVSPDESSPGTRPRPDAQPAPREFVQLTLDATVVGPGMRTADPYEPGTKLKVKGQRGVFTYKYATVSSAGLVSLYLTRDGLSKVVRPEQVSLAQKPRFRK